MSFLWVLILPIKVVESSPETTGVVSTSLICVEDITSSVDGVWVLDTSVDDTGDKEAFSVGFAVYEKQ